MGNPGHQARPDMRKWLSTSMKEVAEKQRIYLHKTMCVYVCVYVYIYSGVVDSYPSNIPRTGFLPFPHSLDITRPVPQQYQTDMGRRAHRSHRTMSRTGAHSSCMGCGRSREAISDAAPNPDAPNATSMPPVFRSESSVTSYDSSVATCKQGRTTSKL